jgi:hypothetical protein
MVALVRVEVVGAVEGDKKAVNEHVPTPTRVGTINTNWLAI